MKLLLVLLSPSEVLSLQFWYEWSYSSSDSNWLPNRRNRLSIYRSTRKIIKSSDSEFLAQTLSLKLFAEIFWSVFFRKFFWNLFLPHSTLPISQPLSLLRRLRGLQNGKAGLFLLNVWKKLSKKSLFSALFRSVSGFVFSLASLSMERKTFSVWCRILSIGIKVSIENHPALPGF